MFIDCVKNFVFVWECWWHWYGLPEWTVMTRLIRCPAERCSSLSQTSHLMPFSSSSV